MGLLVKRPFGGSVEGWMMVVEAGRNYVGARAIDRSLMVAGMALCPLFYAIVLAQMAFRQGFSIRIHPLSLLELGAYGWIQLLNFAACGTLALLFGLGLVRRREPLPLACLLLLSGVGFLVVAIFPPDPYMGFPPGAPAVGGEGMSGQAKLHGLGFMLIFVPTTLACLSVAWMARKGRPGLAALSLIAGCAISVVLAIGFGVQSLTSMAFFAVGIVGFGWISLLAANLAVQRPAAPSPAQGGTALLHRM